MSIKLKLKSFLQKEILQLYLKSLWIKWIQDSNTLTLKLEKKLKNYLKLFILTLDNN
jgi:hypothetical protein